MLWENKIRKVYPRTGKMYFAPNLKATILILDERSYGFFTKILFLNGEKAREIDFHHLDGTAFDDLEEIKVGPNES